MEPEIIVELNNQLKTQTKLIRRSLLKQFNREHAHTITRLIKKHKRHTNILYSILTIQICIIGALAAFIMLL